MHYDVTSHHPDFMMVQFGMNDCNYWVDDLTLPRVSPDSFVANLEEIVDRAVVSGVRHCFLNTNHTSLKGAFPHYEELSYDQSNTIYNQLVRDAHERMTGKGRPVTLIDMERHWLSHLEESLQVSLETLLLDDGIHLSEQGHSVYTAFIIPKVVAELKAMATTES